MGRDEGVMESNTETEGVKTEKTETGLCTKRERGGTVTGREAKTR